MILDNDSIATMIPHQGAMCLLDAVLRWDAASIACLSRRYRAPDNPLRRHDGTLGTATGIELAAQAMAVHGRLIEGAAGAPRPGYLASVRDVRLCHETLETSDGDLLVEAQLLMGDARSAAYSFALTCDGIVLLTGRATVLFAVSQ